jgi:NCAIR mutase (PurE)-related protein
LLSKIKAKKTHRISKQISRIIKLLDKRNQLEIITRQKKITENSAKRKDHLAMVEYRQQNVKPDQNEKQKKKSGFDRVCIGF